MTAITQKETATIESEVNELASPDQHCSPPSGVMAPSLDAVSEVTIAPADPQNEKLLSTE